MRLFRAASGLPRAISVLAIILFVVASSLQSEVQAVGPTGHHVYSGQSIQETIDSAQPGDIVIVHSGTYYENLVVNTPITLVGENKSTTVIDGALSGYTIHVQSTSNVTIANLTIKHGYGEFSCSVFCESSSNVTITSNIICATGRTAVRAHHSNVVIDGNTIIDNVFFGISMFDQSSGRITRNVLRGDFASIQIRHCGGFMVYGNTIADVREASALLITYSTDCAIRYNNISNSKIGIEVEHSDNNFVYQNNFVNNVEQVRSISSINAWDDGIEGNYWSDYDGTDVDRDGIGDKANIIDEKNQDRCPFMDPYIPVGRMQILYSELLREHDELQAEFDSLKSKEEATAQELNNVMLLSYILIVTIVILAADTIRLSTRKRSIKETIERTID